MAVSATGDLVQNTTLASMAMGYFRSRALRSAAGVEAT